jgi:hypothetical protein
MLIPWRTNLKMLFAGSVDAPRRHYEPFMLMTVKQAGEDYPGQDRRNFNC